MASDSRDSAKFKIGEITATVPWGVMAAKTWGDPSARPVLVVHGIQDTAGSFDRLIPLLPSGFYYVCLELPGHGKSSHFPAGIHINFMLYLSSINRFVRHLGWTRFDYLGHSLGGQLGAYYAAMYPEQVSRLVTLDSLPMMSCELAEFMEFYKKMTEGLVQMEEKLSKASPPNYTHQEAVERLMKQRPFPISRAAAEALVSRMLKQGEKGYHFSTDQRLKFTVKIPMSLEQNLYNLSQIKCPYLAIMCRISHTAYMTEDKLGKARSVVELFESMKNVTIAIVDGYHDVHNNEPEVVAPLVSKYLVQMQSNL